MYRRPTCPGSHLIINILSVIPAASGKDNTNEGGGTRPGGGGGDELKASEL